MGEIMRDKVQLILIFLLGVVAFILFFGFVLSNIDPDNKLEAYTLAISFAGIFTTFGGAYLGAKISGEYAINVANKEREEYKQEQKYIRNVYIIKYIEINSIMFSKVNGIYTKLRNIVNNEEVIYKVYNTKEITLNFPEDNETMKVIELHDFIYEFNNLITNIINNEKCIVAEAQYTDALLRIHISSKYFLNTFKPKEIVDYDFNEFKYYLEELMNTCDNINREYDNFWGRWFIKKDKFI